MEVPAYAKLNLTLEVLGRRADGYHEVRTVLQTIDLADRLVVRPGADLRVQCDEPSLEGENNLVWQAAVALAEYRNIPPRAHIMLEKRIPIGMGLGGGSSDAASALVALNQLWGLGLSAGELACLAAKLGSDVAFFLWGGTEAAAGRGEQIRPLPPLPALPVTLICPESTLPDKTKKLYSQLTPDHYSDGESTRRLTEILEAGEFVSDMGHNVFESVALRAFPELSGLRRRASQICGDRLHLCGAGPALFVLPSSEEEYLKVSNALQPSGARVYLVNTIAPRHTGAIPDAGGRGHHQE